MRKMIMAAAAACFFVFPGMADEPGCDELSTVRSAAEQGNAMAMAWLGSAYYTGVCVGQDYGKAVSMFRTAAEKGNAMAQLGIGVMYLQGQGVEQNSREAFKWLLSTARAKFTEVTTAAGPIKQQVELCHFDRETFDGCSDSGSGNGWNLAKAVSEARSRYVFGAEVKNGVITMYSRNIKVNGQEVFTEILVPRIYGSDSAINWEIAPESTCRQADLC